MQASVELQAFVELFLYFSRNTLLSVLDLKLRNLDFCDVSCRSLVVEHTVVSCHRLD